MQQASVLDREGVRFRWKPLCFSHTDLGSSLGSSFIIWVGEKCQLLEASFPPWWSGDLVPAFQEFLQNSRAHVHGLKEGPCGQGLAMQFALRGYPKAQQLGEEWGFTRASWRKIKTGWEGAKVNLLLLPGGGMTAARNDGCPLLLPWAVKESQRG